MNSPTDNTRDKKSGLARACRNMFAAALVAAVVATGTVGCMPTIIYGSPLPTAGLADLTVGESTRSEVLLTLGEPRGEGGAEFSQQGGRSRDAWYYDYTISKGGAITTSYMVVFFENDLYDGYWWVIGDL
jgi:outer membrane protein assembly factor BamE (lipoprotein component of BamABCDE complex)